MSLFSKILKKLLKSSGNKNKLPSRTREEILKRLQKVTSTIEDISEENRVLAEELIRLSFTNKILIFVSIISILLNLFLILRVLGVL